MKSLKESLEILKNFPIEEVKDVKSEDDFPKQFPFYLKADIPEHKTELGGIKKCHNIEEARKALVDLRRKFGNKIISQKEVEGIEMIVGIKKDKTFGYLLAVGFGGIFVESIKDISFRAIPVTRHDIIDMLRELKNFPILESKRKKLALGKFVKLVYSLSKLKTEIDLNPIIINEKEVKIIDARIGN